MAVTPIFKPRDVVRTPSGRTAQVVDLNHDGTRELMYLDKEGGYVTLETRMLHLVKEATPLPWPSRKVTA